MAADPYAHYAPCQAEHWEYSLLGNGLMCARPTYSVHVHLSGNCARLVALAPVDGPDEQPEDAGEEHAHGVVVGQPPVQREVLADDDRELLQEVAREARLESQRLGVRCRHLQLGD